MMKEIYEEMRQRNTQKIKNEGLFIDHIIASPVADSRQGIGVFCLSEFVLNAHWYEMMDESKHIFSNQTFYNLANTTPPSRGILHHTFFQFVKVDDLPSEGISDNTLHEYKNILQSVLAQIKPYTITYKGIMAIPSGLLMCGYPDEDINTYRDQIREKIMQSGIYFKEPYKADTFHSTLVRLNSPEDAQNLLDFADTYKDLNFGTLQVRELSLMYGSWSMRADEISPIATFPL